MVESSASQQEKEAENLLDSSGQEPTLKKKGHVGPRKRRRKQKAVMDSVELNAVSSPMQKELRTKTLTDPTIQSLPSNVEPKQCRKNMPTLNYIQKECDLQSYTLKAANSVGRGELSALASPFIYNPKVRKERGKNNTRTAFANEGLVFASAEITKPFEYEDAHVDVSVFDQSWYDQQQSWIFSKHAGSLQMISSSESALGSPVRNICRRRSMSKTPPLMPLFPTFDKKCDNPPSPMTQLRKLATSVPLPFQNIGAGFGYSSSSLDLWQEQQERLRWSAWAVQAAEKERERRLQESKMSEEREVAERQSRVQWAINAVETERQERLMKNYLSTLSSTRWFNEIVSSFGVDYELVCPYYYFGCTSRCYRSNINEHLQECKYKVQEDEIIRVRSRLKGGATKSTGSDVEDNVNKDYEAVCPNTILGCSYTGSLAGMQEHLVESCRFRIQTHEQEKQQRALVQKQVKVDVEAERLRQRDGHVSAASLPAGITILLGNQIQETLRSLHLHALELWNTCAVCNEQRRADDTAILHHIKKRTQLLWPHSHVEVIGSAATGLFSPDIFRYNTLRTRSNSNGAEIATDIADTPSSDLDLVVCFSDDMQSVLHSDSSLVRILAGFLESNGDGTADVSPTEDGQISPHSTVSLVIQQILPHAHVPLIKAIATVRSYDSGSSSVRVVSIPVDISMDGPRNTGIASTAMIKVLLAALPPLGPVFLVLKAFLRSKALDNAYTGGLGSYGLLLMVILPLLKQLRRVPKFENNPAAESEPNGHERVEKEVQGIPSSIFTSLHNTASITSSNKLPKSGSKEEDRAEHPQRRMSSSSVRASESEEHEPARRKSGGSHKHILFLTNSLSWQNVVAQKVHGWRIGMGLLNLALPVDAVAEDPTTSHLPEPLLKLESPICGVVLEEFLRCYGEEMQCGRQGFSVREGGFRFDLVPIGSEQNTSEPTHPRAGDPLVIEDPIDVTSNVSQHCYRAVAIQKAFMDALEVLRGMAARWDARIVKAHVIGPRISPSKPTEPIVHAKASANVAALSRAISAALLAQVPAPETALEPVPLVSSSVSSSKTLLEDIFSLERL